MKNESNGPILPNSVSALWLACKCIGVEATDTERVAIHRARKAEGDIETIKELVTTLEERLLRPLRGSIELASHPNTVADWLIVCPLRLYDRLLPHLRAEGIDQRKAMWLLAHEVFIPTFYSILVEHRRLGTGSEFEFEECWYLPSETQTPIQRVLDYWLRVAKLNTAYGLNKRFQQEGKDESGSNVTPDTESTKQRFQRWVRGETKPSLKDLHKLVDQQSKEVKWLDGARAWKGRFTLAYAVQTACKEADEYFEEIHPTPAQALVQSYRALVQNPPLRDDAGFLGSAHLMFASRLYGQRTDVQRRMRIIAKNYPKDTTGTFQEGTPQKEIEAWTREMQWWANRGNWLLYLIKRCAIRERAITAVTTTTNYALLDEFAFGLGVSGMEQRAGGHQARQP